MSASVTGGMATKREKARQSGLAAEGISALLPNQIL
jgi:hypothetical protein